MRKGLLLSLLSSVFFSAPMFGAYLIDFGTGLAGNGGTITVSGSTVTGSGIPIGSMTVTGDGGFDGVYIVTNGALNFSFTGNPSSGATTFSISGTVGACVTSCGGTPLNNAVSGTLLTGTSPDNFSYTTPTTNSISISGSGPDTKSTTLLSALGIPASTLWNFSGFSIGGVCSPDPTVTNCGGVYTGTSTDIGNNSVVPEPTSVLLLGTVLLGVTGLIRRRSSQA